MDDPTPVMFYVDKFLTVGASLGAAFLAAFLTSRNSIRVTRISVDEQRESEDRKRREAALEAAHQLMMRAWEATHAARNIEYSDREVGGMLTQESEAAYFRDGFATAQAARESFNDLQFLFGRTGAVVVAAHELLDAMEVAREVASDSGPFRPNHLPEPTEEQALRATARLASARTNFDVAVQAARPRTRVA